MKRICCFIFALLALAGGVTAQPARPKLVVGLVVDQMRWDYLYRYAARYGNGGFNRLLTEGYSCENTRLPYIPSVTAIGHTCIYTGSVPSITGIAGNNFVKDGRVVYCTDDATVHPVGTKSAAGLMSPRNLWVTTVGDELRAATNNRAKVIGVALKDRASILPAGHNPTAAYWFDPSTGHFITSDYYMKRLPDWLNTFNAEGRTDKYLSGKWETLYPKDTYKESTADDTPYEKSIAAGVSATLPLDLKALKAKHGYGIIRSTPFGNSLTLEMAKAAIAGEQLGQRGETDFLAVSCSSTDYVGHQVGLRAVETEDTYLRLDRDIADFLTYLDTTLGKGNYLIFLSADHGAMDNPRYLTDNRTPAGVFDDRRETAVLDSTLNRQFGHTGLVGGVMNYQVFFNTARIDSLNLDYAAVKAAAVKALKRQPEVLYTCDMELAATAAIPDEVKSRIINGYNRERSGGVQIITKPGYYDGDWKGTSHGMWNPYDTHIPLVFMGWGIKHGATTRECRMTDIAPTICALLHIQAPSGCVGQPIF